MSGTSCTKQGKFRHLLTAKKATQHDDVQLSPKKSRHRKEIRQGKSHERTHSGLNTLNDDSGKDESQSARKVRTKRDLSDSLRSQDSPRRPTQLDIRSFLSPKDIENELSSRQVRQNDKKPKSLNRNSHCGDGINRKPRKRILRQSSSSDSVDLPSFRKDTIELDGNLNEQRSSTSEDEKDTWSSIRKLKKTSLDGNQSRTKALSKNSSSDSVDLPSFRQDITPNIGTLSVNSPEEFLITRKTNKRSLENSLQSTSKSLLLINDPGGGGTFTKKNKKLATVAQSVPKDIPIKKKAPHRLDHSSNVVCKSSLAKKARIDRSSQDKNQTRNEKACKTDASSVVKTSSSKLTCTTKSTKSWPKNSAADGSSTKRSSPKTDKVSHKPSSSKSQGKIADVSVKNPHEPNERRQKPGKESNVTENRDYFGVKTKRPQTTTSSPPRSKSVTNLGKLNKKEPGGSGVQRKPLGIHIKRADGKEKPGSKKSASKTTLVKCASSDSDDLPFFRKRSQQQKQSEAFKKYGIVVPSIEEMIAEKKHLANYRQQVEEAQKIEEPLFSWPTLPQKTEFQEPLLDCKDVTLDELTEHFNKNAAFLTDITEGKTYSDRHRRYHDANQWQNKFTIRDLTYNTSTIVFTFNQVDHMASLIEKKFDEDNQKSCYIFQVLLPELCMRIFMSKHDMSRTQAKKYLDMRPVE